jgi:thioredoxin reductase-like selenoprotein T
VFDQFAYAIQQKYPELIIHGDVYPPTAVNALVAQVISIAKLIVIMLIVGGQNPFTWLQMETPGIFSWALDNKASLKLIILKQKLSKTS